MTIQKRIELVNGVIARLSQDLNAGIACIPQGLLRQEIGYAVSRKLADVEVKIPGRCEFTMTVQEAEAVLAELRDFDKGWR